MSPFKQARSIRGIAAIVFAAAFAGALTGCAGTVSSQSLVKPSAELANRVAQAPVDTTATNGLHLVYGYAQPDNANCSADAAPSDPMQRYGVVVCDDQTPLAVAYYNGKAPAGASRERLARIAASSLAPEQEVIYP